MKKIKRIAALIGVVFLLALYVITLISAIISTPATAGLFKASLFCTMVVPIMLYIIQMLFHFIEPHDKNNTNEDDENNI